MNRETYQIFSPGAIAGLATPNRLVRSATWDPSILAAREMQDEVLALYRRLAEGGVGMIVTGGFPVYRERFPDEDHPAPYFTYPDLRVSGLEKLPQLVHQAITGCKIIAQIEVGYIDSGPSSIPSPFSNEPVRELPQEEIERILGCFVDAVIDMRDAGFDGVQLHAAHGGLLSRFLSPYTNRREDRFGGSVQKRVSVIRDIIQAARQRAGDFPILIKLNCTDYLEGGIDLDTFPALAQEVVKAGVDAVEISGGMWECLFRSEEELGFRPVPAPESHTRIHKAEQQSYFLKYAESVRLPVPLILTGGNRDIERLEAILQGGRVDFIALCRPLIREPGLPDRWRAGAGSRLTECVSCNSCLYAMYVHPGQPEAGPVQCVCKTNKKMHRDAQKWLAAWRDQTREELAKDNS